MLCFFHDAAIEADFDEKEGSHEDDVDLDDGGGHPERGRRCRKAGTERHKELGWGAVTKRYLPFSYYSCRVMLYCSGAFGAFTLRLTRCKIDVAPVLGVFMLPKFRVLIFFKFPYIY